MVLGVDPGSTTGWAVVHKGRLVHCRQTAKATAIDAIKQTVWAYDIKTAFVELPRLGVLYSRPWSHAAKKIPDFSASGRITREQYSQMMDSAKKQAVSLTAGQIKIAQNVGQNIEWTHVIAGTLEGIGVRVKKVAPRPRGSKWDVQLWMRTFNWPSSRHPGEHARDAACLAYLNEGKAGI